jgi:Secretion system C-terminal sorting domain/SprB repeat
MTKFWVLTVFVLGFAVSGWGQGVLSVGVVGHDANCHGSNSGYATVFAIGGAAPYSYVWSPAVSTTDSAGGLSAGTYSVTVTDHNGIAAHATVTIGQPSPLLVGIDSLVYPPCFRTTSGVCGCTNKLWAVVSGGVPPYSYLWTPGGGTSDTLVGACYLEFTVAVTDNHNCVVSDSILVTIPATHGLTGIANLENSEESVAFYPNPAANELNIGFNPRVNVAKNIVVIDAMGTVVANMNVAPEVLQSPIDISKLPSGNYLLKVSGEGMEIFTGHFTVAK